MTDLLPAFPKRHVFLELRNHRNTYMKVDCNDNKVNLVTKLSALACLHAVQLTGFLFSYLAHNTTFVLLVDGKLTWYMNL